METGVQKRKVKAFKYRESENGRIIVVNRTIKEFPYAVKEKLFKGEIPSEKLILLDKDNAQICDDDVVVDILDNNGIYFAKVLYS